MPGQAELTEAAQEEERPGGSAGFGRPPGGTGGPPGGTGGPPGGTSRRAVTGHPTLPPRITHDHFYDQQDVRRLHNLTAT